MYSCLGEMHAEVLGMKCPGVYTLLFNGLARKCVCVCVFGERERETEKVTAGMARRVC